MKGRKQNKQAAAAKEITALEKTQKIAPQVKDLDLKKKDVEKTPKIAPQVKDLDSAKKENVSANMSDGETERRNTKRLIEPQPAITYFDETQLSVNTFRGFVHLAVLAGVVFVLTHAVTSYFEHGFIFDTSVFDFTFNDIYHTLLVFSVMFAFSTTTYFLEVITLYVPIPRILLRLVHHIILLALLVGVLWEVFRRETPFVASVFLCMETIVLGMKMHSYFSVNRDLADGIFTPSHVLKYPQNVTFSNYMLFMMMPTLIYRPSYPRTERIRIRYMAERFFACIFILIILSITISEYVDPVLSQQMTMSPFLSIAKLAMPMMVVHLCIFFMIFEVILNGFAELTCFADRHFYSDWWNSTAFDEYARKWNKPVHNWLLEHIYNESIEKINFSKKSAMWTTFLFSSLLHELVLTVGFRMVHVYLFAMQMSQIPLIWLGRHPFFRGTVWGNLFFWFGIFFGPPILTILYVREHIYRQNMIA
eukprot:TRINITY_DN2418_c0_g1_i16.p1 TRINITY_DN2418_c0_g1~~TRINITY_DN2418_c0_g1_i16.p1  ORF type:complete len:477 (+),score=99.28 TRINITY_DN2418_c0_g1_i16:48-1478(+)